MQRTKKVKLKLCSLYGSESLGSRIQKLISALFSVRKTKQGLIVVWSNTEMWHGFYLLLLMASAGERTSCEYWSLPVASAHLDASAIPLSSQYNLCWHREFNLDILVMMKVVVIGLNWDWQCDIATTAHYSSVMENTCTLLEYHFVPMTPKNDAFVCFIYLK